MNRLLSTILLIILLLGGSSLVAFGWTQSCPFLMEEPLQRVVASEVETPRSWEKWVQENYGYFAWNFSKTDWEGTKYIFWHTPFKQFQIRILADQKIKTAHFRTRFTPTSVHKVQSCFGDPSYYEAYELYRGSGYELNYGMWYPSRGIRAGFRWIYGGDSMVEEGYQISDDTRLYEFHFVAPNLIDEEYSDYNAYVQSDLPQQDLKVWKGIDEIYFDIVY